MQDMIYPGNEYIGFCRKCKRPFVGIEYIKIEGVYEASIKQVICQDCLNKEGNNGNIR